jgi:diguanylate cyclase (GGDEF)-like protein
VRQCPQNGGVSVPERVWPGRVLAATTILGGLAFVLVTGLLGVPPHWFTIGLGILMIAISELYPLEMPQGSINLASAGFFSVLLVAGIQDALWALFLGSALSYLRVPFRGLRSVSNTGNYLLSLTLAWLVARALNLSPATMAPYILTVVATFIFVNHLLVNLYYYLLEGPSTIDGMVQAVWWDLLGWGLTLPLALIFYELRVNLGGYGEAITVIPYGALAVAMGAWKQVHSQSRRLEAVAAASARLGASRSPLDVYRTVTESLEVSVGYKELRVYLWDQDHRRLVAGHVVGTAAERLGAATTADPTVGVIGRVIRSQKPELVGDLDAEERANGGGDEAMPIRSALVLPLTTEEDLLGVVWIGHGERRHYNIQHLRLASILVGQAAIALERNQLLEEKERLALTDPMIPELFNVRYFRELLEEAIGRASAERPLSLAFLDLDRFKSVNDTHGHQAGDEVLNQVVKVIRHAIRGEDVLARYAGDEFVVLLENTPGEKAREIVERVAGAVAAHRLPHVGKALTVSVGVATYPTDADGISQLLGLADARMYLQKSARRAEASNDRIS